MNIIPNITRTALANTRTHTNKHTRNTPAPSNEKTHEITFGIIQGAEWRGVRLGGWWTLSRRAHVSFWVGVCVCVCTDTYIHTDICAQIACSAAELSPFETNAASGPNGSEWDNMRGEEQWGLRVVFQNLASCCCHCCCCCAVWRWQAGKSTTACYNNRKPEIKTLALENQRAGGCLCVAVGYGTKHLACCCVWENCLFVCPNVSWNCVRCARRECDMMINARSGVVLSVRNGWQALLEIIAGN